MEHTDRELYTLISQESQRQKESVNFIASENVLSASAKECLSSVLSNKYAEGRPGARYYGGCKIVDEIEKLCEKRALSAFCEYSEDWSVNVQCLSGSPAVFAAYMALCNPRDTILGMDLAAGGHLTHGFIPASGKKITSASLFYSTFTYGVDINTGRLDYAEIEKMALELRPAVLVCGASAYPREINFSRFGEIAKKCGARLLADISHISAFVALGLHQSPFPHADIVVTTTHKTLRGPRGALLFYRKHLQERVNTAIFPGIQGGPHLQTIAAIATTLNEVKTSLDYMMYARDTLNNAKVLANAFMREGIKVVTNGTNNHIVLVDLTENNLSVAKVLKELEEVHSIVANKNCVPGDKSALRPNGIRFGTACLTSRGCGEEEILQYAETIISVIMKHTPQSV